MNYAVTNIHITEFSYLVDKYVTKLDKKYRTKLKELFIELKKNRKDNFRDEIEKWARQKPPDNEKSINLNKTIHEHDYFRNKSSHFEFDEKCDFCSKDLSKRHSDPKKYAYECIFCDKYFCEDHRSAPNHNCENINEFYKKYPNYNNLTPSNSKQNIKKEPQKISHHNKKKIPELVIVLIVIIAMVGLGIFLSSDIKIYDVNTIQETKTIQEEVRENISIEKYLNNRIDYYTKNVQVIGNLGYFLDGDKSGGIWEYYILDDMGRKLSAANLSKEHKKLFPKGKTSEKTYIISGIFNSNGLIPKISVNDIKIYNRKIKIQEKNITIEKEINSTTYNTTTRRKILLNFLKEKWNNFIWSVDFYLITEDAKIIDKKYIQPTIKKYNKLKKNAKI